MLVQTEVEKAPPQRRDRSEPLERIDVQPIPDMNEQPPRAPAVWLVIALIWILFVFTLFLIWFRTK